MRRIARIALVRWSLVLAVASVGVAVSTVVTPPTVAVPGPVGGDKFLHAGGYFGFTLVLLSALAPYRSSMMAHSPLVIAFAVAVVLGTSMELAQLFVAGRVFSLGDVLANVLGAGAAVVGWHLLVLHPVSTLDEGQSTGNA